MNNDRDVLLQTLFAEANKELEGENFTGRVMAQTRSWRKRLIAGSAGLLSLLLIATWVLNIPLFEFAQQVSLVFTISLFDLGEGWTAWAFAPVNNIWSLLILGVKALHLIRKKAIGASYVS